MSDWSSFLETPPAFFGEDCVTSLISNFTTEYCLAGPAPEVCQAPTSFESLERMDHIAFPAETAGSTELGTRGVVLSDVPDGVEIEEITETVQKYGPVERVDKEEDGSFIVYYFDIRSSQWLRKADVMIGGQLVSLSFAALEEVKDQKKPPNNGTIVVFHLPADTPMDELNRMFAVFGQIKQIRHTPFKTTQRFIEYYDKRAAEEALTKLNGKFVRESRISIEYSLPGGFRRNTPLQLTTATGDRGRR